MTVGALMGAIGFLGLSLITEHSSYVGGVLPSMMALAFGLGMIFVTTTVVAVSGVSPNESGLSSALLNVGQMLGGSTGLAVLGTVAATVTKNDLLNSFPSRALISHAITAGYATAFQVACVVAAAAVVIAVASVTSQRRSTTMEAVTEAA
jgi:hypothetical protein